MIGRGRPRNFVEDDALERAMVTFWRQGYENTSLDDLVAATGASRTGLYGVFGDKRALLRRALSLYGERFSERISKVLEAPSTGRERMRAVLNVSADRLASASEPPGCLRCNSTLELMGRDEDFDRFLSDANRRFVETLGRLVERSVEDGEIAAEAGRPLALYFTAIVNGMVTLARSGASRGDLAVVIETALAAWPAGERDLTAAGAEPRRG